MPSLINKFDLSSSVRYIKNVGQHKALMEHPLLLASPLARSVLVIEIPAVPFGAHAAMIIIDPSSTMNSQLINDLHEGAALASELFHRADNAVPSSLRPPGLAEGVPEGAVTEFLLETLKTTRSLKSRRKTSYLTLRTWQTSIKKFQISAIKSLKKQPSPEFVSAIASEFINASQMLVGTKGIDTVVPMPCGHSRSDECLSVRIARRIAEAYPLTFHMAFKSVHRSGSSHPRRNVDLPAFKLVSPPSGNVLLVDDIATTGTHIEKAKEILLKQARNVLAIAWIG
ncbi:MAG TPA: hypothetical protein PK264_00635 [Hyphomicrobiaceae bacterium]|nr:hypothetical protein [Hyphomicrobiaceae bacterium]